RWRARRRAAAAGGWLASDALHRGVLLGIFGVLIGVLAHRLEPLLLALPLLTGSLIALLANPRGVADLRPRRLPTTVQAGESARTAVDVRTPAGTELLALRVPRSGGQPGGESGGRSGTAAPGRLHVVGGDAVSVGTTLRWRTWGTPLRWRLDYLLAGPDALLICGPVVGVERRTTVLPPVPPLPPMPCSPRSGGLVGVHRSPRAGDGTELRDIRRFVAGDRLRRIDWRVSLRAAAANSGQPIGGQLYVRERHAEADAHVLLAIDTRVDVGPDMDAWSMPAPGALTNDGGSLDATVRASAALAATFLRQGDRVGLADLGRPHLSVRPASGRRQLDVLRHQLIRCAQSAGWAQRAALPSTAIASGSLVVFISPLIDDAVLDLAVHAIRRGARVLVIDVLPARLVPPRDTPWGESVLRLMRVERAVRLRAMSAHGVLVVPFSNGAGLSEALRMISRPRRPMAIRR
ncbi:MAG: DUF58 domain-containing protein, partial [Sciscionella sp.]|nr:DUF58 domain-containing protein [Sciscionella sp.]